jgi:Protein of unknwon function (DUF3310)
VSPEPETSELGCRCDFCISTRAQQKAVANSWVNPAAVTPLEIATETVNHPPHYGIHGVECIDLAERLSFCLGNVIKYCYRCDAKGSPVEDLEKALWYLKREIALRKKLEGDDSSRLQHRVRGQCHRYTAAQ